MTSASKATIRRARARDLDVLDRVERRSFDRDRFPRRNLRRLLQSPTAKAVVVVNNGSPAGYAMVLFRENSGVARLYSIAVDPDFRGKGLAGALIDAAVREARRRGADRLRLELRPSNKRALRLYERAGFTFHSRKLGYYDDGEDAVRMELTLLAPPLARKRARA